MFLGIFAIACGSTGESILNNHKFEIENTLIEEVNFKTKYKSKLSWDKLVAKVDLISLDNGLSDFNPVKNVFPRNTEYYEATLEVIEVSGTKYKIKCDVGYSQSESRQKGSIVFTIWNCHNIEKSKYLGAFVDSFTVDISKN